MTEPWFDPNLYAWIPGTLLGVIGGLVGSLGGVIVSRGVGKHILYTVFITVIAFSAVLLLGAIVGLATGQPFGVWYSLGLPGIIGLIVFGSLLPVLRNAYREAELRRLSAADL